MTVDSLKRIKWWSCPPWSFLRVGPNWEACQPEGRTSRLREAVRRQGLLPRAREREIQVINTRSFVKVREREIGGEREWSFDEVKESMKSSHHLLRRFRCFEVEWMLDVTQIKAALEVVVEWSPNPPRSLEEERGSYAINAIKVKSTCVSNDQWTSCQPFLTLEVNATKRSKGSFPGISAAQEFGRWFHIISWRRHRRKNRFMGPGEVALRTSWIV